MSVYLFVFFIWDFGEYITVSNNTLNHAMAGKGKSTPKASLKVKPVKLAKPTMAQRKIDAFAASAALSAGVCPSTNVNVNMPTNCTHDQVTEHEHEPDLEEAVLTNGTEWADVESDNDSVHREKPTWADVALPKLANVNPGKPVAGPTTTSGASTPSPIPTLCGTQSLQHKSEVAPIFLGYSRVLSDGQLIPLIQVTAAVVTVMGNTDSLDAVQPMKAGWYIYMTTLH